MAYGGFLQGFTQGFLPSYSQTGERFLAQRSADKSFELQKQIADQQMAADRQRMKFLGEDRAIAAEERDSGLTQKLNQALQIQNAVDAGRASGTLSADDVAMINAGGGGEQQLGLLSSLTTANKAAAANAPKAALEQQALEALIGQREAAAAAASRPPAGPAELQIAQAVQQDPTLLDTLADVAGAKQQPKGPVSLAEGAALVDPATGQVIAERAKTAAPKAPGSDLTTQQKNDLGKARKNFSQLETQIGGLQNLLKEQGTAWFPGELRDEIDSRRTDLLLTLKELANLGVLNGPDMELMERMLLDPTPAGLAKPLAFMQEVVSTIGQKPGLAERTIKNLGVVLESGRDKLRAAEESVQNQGAINYDQFTDEELEALEADLARKTSGAR